MNTYLIPVEITAETDGDAKILTECLWSILTEVIGQYLELGDLEPYSRIRLFQSPPIDLNDEQLELRAKREARLRGFWRNTEWQRREQNEPAKQLPMPGLTLP